MNFKLIEVAIGLIFVYLLLSIFAMVLMEMISTFLRLRGVQLKRTIEKMLFNKDENPQQINAFYLQPLVLFLGDEVSGFNFLNKIFSGKHSKLPSYMRNEDFYTTFLTFINHGEFTDSLSVIREKVGKAALSKDTKTHLNFLIEKSKDDVEKFKTEMCHWFEECMQRANTWYSRKVQYTLIFLGFCIAVGVNGDTLRIIDKLNNDEKLRTEMVQSAENYIKNNPEVPAEAKAKNDSIKINIAKEYDNLLVDSHNLLGYESNNLTLKNFDMKSDFSSLALKIFGFLLTALAISLGSNFWFDMLKKMLNVRTLGKSTQK